MADLYGAQRLPLSPGPGARVVVPPSPADPLLAYLASYFATVANTRLGLEWGSLMYSGKSVPTAEKVIEKTFLDMPGDELLRDSTLPALYVYRDPENPPLYEQVTADSRVSREGIYLLWVLPDTGKEKVALRARFPSKLFHMFDALVEANRDPAWRVQGDLEARAEDEGSSLATLAPFWSLKMVRGARRVPVTAQEQGGEGITFPAFQALLEVRELYVPDPDRNPVAAGLAATVSVPAGTNADGDALPTISLQSFVAGPGPHPAPGDE